MALGRGARGARSGNWPAFSIARYRIAVQAQFSCNRTPRPALPGEVDDLLITEMASGPALLTETLLERDMWLGRRQRRTGLGAQRGHHLA